MKIKASQIEHFPSLGNAIVSVPVDQSRVLHIVVEENTTVKELVQIIEKTKG